MSDDAVKRVIAANEELSAKIDAIRLENKRLREVLKNIAEMGPGLAEAQAAHDARDALEEV